MESNACRDEQRRKQHSKDYAAAYIFVAAVAALLFVSAGNLDATLVTAQWDPSSDADVAGYVVSYGTASGQYATAIDVGNVTSSALAVNEGQTYYLAVQAYDTGGLIGPYSSEVVFTIPAGSPPGLPAGWQAQDVGAVGLAGSAQYSTNRFTVAGAGADIWGSADAFQFVHTTLAGDGAIVARVTTEQNTGAHAKAGVMFRTTTDAGSAHVILDVQPGGAIEFMTRQSTGGATSFIAGSTAGMPVWLELTRSGNTITGFTSADGQAWTQVGRTETALAAGIEAGLAVTSHTTSALNTSTFDDVALTAAGAGPPSGPSDIVIYAADVPAANRHGTWSAAGMTGAAAGTVLATPDNGVAQTSNALGNPADYIDVPFNAQGGVPYTIWLRLRAINDSKYNDSVWVQFSDASVSGTAAYPINSPAALLVNLATTSDASGLQGWGWSHGAYWLQQPATVTFAGTGAHVVRIQVREDGVQFDQIVFSPKTYLTSAPGAASNDAVIVPKQP